MDNGLRMDESQIEALKNHVAQITPLGYMAQPEEIATAALFLASADAKYVNGVDRKSTRLNSSHFVPSRMPSSA